MSHDAHESLPGYARGQLLVDGCRECEERAGLADHGLSHLDEISFARAWVRARRLRERGLPDVSNLEYPLLWVLSCVQVQLARYNPTTRRVAGQ